jgi:hypothetical protein
MTDLPAPVELAFLFRDTAEIERRLERRSNWRSFSGIGRKSNAGWSGAEARKSDRA